MPARDVLDRFHIRFLFGKTIWIWRIREVLPRFDSLTPDQRQIVQYWANAVLAFRAAERAGRPVPSRHARHRPAEEPAESEDRELFEIATFTEGLTANADDPVEWLDRMGRGKTSNRVAAIIVGLNNNQGPRLVATFTRAAPPLRRMMERTAAAHDLATPPQDAGGREILSFLSELLARIKCPSEEEFLAAFESLTVEEGRELADDGIVIAEVGAPSADPDFARELILRVGCLVPGSLDGLHERLRRLNLRLPAFLTAPPGESFGDWLQSAVRRKELDDYGAKDSGWEVGDEPRSLCFDVAYALTPTPEDTPGAIGPVKVFADHEGRCGICRERLSTLFELDLRDSRIGFLGVPGDRLRFAFCEQCVVDSPTFTSVNGKGRSRWIPGPGQPSTVARWGERLRRLLRGERIEPFDPDLRMPRGGLQLGPKRRSPYAAYTEVRFNNRGNSQLGGVPCWEQDVDYPICPSCQRTMNFIAQVDRMDLHHGDGILYAFLCRDCKVAAAGEQMT